MYWTCNAYHACQNKLTLKWVLSYSDTIRKSELMNGKQKYVHWEEGCELWKKTSDKIADACDCMFSCLE